VVKGSKHTKESKEKMSRVQKSLIGHSGRFRRGQVSYKPWLGKKHPQSEESRGKISRTLKGRRPANFGKFFGLKGEGNPNWKGGISRTKEYKQHWRQLMRAKRRGATGTHSMEEWRALKERFDFMCLCCKKREPEIKLTKDHIIPLSKGGSNDISNIQPLCNSCNLRKFTGTEDYRVIEGHKKVFAFLKG
jgi:5-methylcytosine-specific restriction endonuclease McrA